MDGLAWIKSTISPTSAPRISMSTRAGRLVEVTPVDGIQPRPPVGEGGYGDSFCNDDEYGTPREIRGRCARQSAVGLEPR